MIDQIILFFQKNRDLITIPIASILSAYLAAYLTTRFRRTQERKAQHLKEIKDKVFQPLKKGIDGYYLPTLKEKRVNIGIYMKPKYNKFVTKEDYKKASKQLEPMFITLSPEEARLHPERSIYRKYSSFVPDAEFYSCVKEKHFPSFIQKWEKFKQKFDVYNERCLQIAQKIKEEIRKGTNLPSYKGNFTGTNPCICEYDLALFVLKKSLQENYNKLLTIKEETHLTILYVENKGVAKGGNLQEIKECEEKIKELVQTESRTTQLAKQAGALTSEAKALRDEIERLLKQKRFPNKCEYI